MFSSTATKKLVWSSESAPMGSPLVGGDVQVFVDGQEGLFEEGDPLALLLLRLVKNGLHLLHIARNVAVHLLQDLFIASTNLKKIPISQNIMTTERNDKLFFKPKCSKGMKTPNYIILIFCGT